MGRNRSRSYSRSPPPRRRHYDDVSRSRGRDGGGGSRYRDEDLPCGLLVRNIPRDSSLSVKASSSLRQQKMYGAKRLLKL